MSDTPRTDGVCGVILDANEKWAQSFDRSVDGGYVPADFARGLERELAALKRGEFICAKCGLRKDGEHSGEADF